MYIRSLCAAAVVAVGVGQADAATVVNYDLWLRYEGTAFRSIEYYESVPEGNLLYEGDVPANATLPGVESYLFGSIAIGNVIHFVMQVVHPDVPVEDDLYYGNGGRTPICQMGAWDCTRTNYTSSDFNNGIPDEKFANARDDEWSLSGNAILGSGVDVAFWAGGHADLPVNSEDGAYLYWYDYEFSNFTVVPPPSPVPLPATAALLPLGVGALALMRRRRRSLS